MPGLREGVERYCVRVEDEIDKAFANSRREGEVFVIGNEHTQVLDSTASVKAGKTPTACLLERFIQGVSEKARNEE